MWVVVVVCLVGLVFGFFLWGNLFSITSSLQLLTDQVSHWSGNAEKKKKSHSDWMSSVDLFLEDEGQLYGNMEEAASARTPAACLEVWSGDHRQTPGGLKKSKGSKSFRKKLTNPTGCIGSFVPPDEDLLGGFLPVFWDVLRANLHAVVDIDAVVD